MPCHITVDKSGIFLCVHQHVRPWAHQTHVALEYVEELRELVDVRTPHDVAEAELARVVLGGLQPVGILVHVHRAELQAVKLPPVQSVALLFEDDGAGALQFDDDAGNDVNHREYREQEDAGNQNVEAAFDETVRDILERFVAYTQQHGVAHMRQLHPFGQEV